MDDDVVAALQHLEVERPEGFELAGERRIPADLAWVDETVGEAGMDEGRVEPDHERHDEHPHVEGKVHVHLDQGDLIKDKRPPNADVDDESDQGDAHQQNDGVEPARPELREDQR